VHTKLVGHNLNIEILYIYNYDTDHATSNKTWPHNYKAYTTIQLTHWHINLQYSSNPTLDILQEVKTFLGAKRVLYKFKQEIKKPIFFGK